MAQNQLPKDWVKCDVVKLSINGYKNGKPQLKEGEILKTVKIPKESMQILNEQSHNSLKLYKKIATDKPLKKMTKEELLKVADDKGINPFEGGPTKAEIIKTIEVVKD